MPKKKRIVEKSTAKRSRKENKKPMDEKNIIVDFSSKTVFYSCKIKEFTNFYKSHDEFIALRKELFGQALSYFNSTTLEKLSSNSNTTHTHPIKEKEKLELIEKILFKLLKNINKDTKDDLIGKIVDNYMEEIWQLGYNQGVRLIGVRSDNIFKVLFIDHLHLIYPNPKYNNLDVMKNSYCAMNS